MQDYLRTISGEVFRHTKDEQTLICGATRLGGGQWLIVKVPGIQGGVVNGRTQGTQVSVDLWIHPSDGSDPLPVQWTYATALKPLMILFTPGDRQVPYTPIGNMGDLATRDYIKLSFVGSTDDDGSIYDLPWPMEYDCFDRTRFGIVGRYNHGYGFEPGMIGKPLLDSTGKLQGVMVGKDWGEYSHAGFFSPVAMVEPLLAVLNVRVSRMDKRESTYKLCIDPVNHETNDVYFN
jgi:hypothetical protein